LSNKQQQRLYGMYDVISVLLFILYTGLENFVKNSLIIHEENTKKNRKRVVSVYVIQIHVDLHKL
jgi:hypothetical protein